MALLSLAACSEKPASPVDTRPPPGLAERFYPPHGWTMARFQAHGVSPLRYGVASPATAIRADILILPNVGEPAETWFETVNALVAQGYNVWVLELPGPGDSTRPTDAKIPQKTPSLGRRPVSVNQFVDQIVRPRGPLILVGEGVGAQIGLQSLKLGLPVAGAVLAHPGPAEDQPFKTPGSPGLVGGIGTGLYALGLGGVPLPGKTVWASGDPQRERAAEAWMAANPGLRPGGPSWAWVSAYRQNAASAMKADGVKPKAPAILLGGEETRVVCAQAFLRCRFIAVPAGPVQRGPDAVRNVWVKAVEEMLKSSTEGTAVAAPPVGRKRTAASRRRTVA